MEGGGWCNLDVLHCLSVPPLFCCCYRYVLISVRLVKNNLYFAHVLRSADYHLHFLMSSLKIPVCARRVLVFDIIMESEIVWPPSLANDIPFSNCYISWDRRSAGLYRPIILTAFSSRSISSIAL